MKNGLYSNNFAEAFSKLMDETGVPCYQIHQFSGLDQGYLSRLKRGQKCNPSVETVVKISLALVRCSPKITLYDVENLLNSVGRSLLIKH